jgi:hypothetical protein
MIRVLKICFLSLLVVTAVNASDNKTGNSEETVILKARNRAEKAREGDWKTLADCANTLIKIGISSEEVIKWIEKSISVQENFYNVSLQGDYYRLKKEFTKANEKYLKAIHLAQMDNNQDAVSNIQWKILITLGSKNYYQSLKDQE